MNKDLHITFFWLFCTCFLANVQLAAQQDTLPVFDTIPLVDSTQMARLDSIPLDSIRPATTPTQTVSYSKDALDEPVDYEARDSIVYDIVNKKIYLYGAASIAYTTLTLKADYIVFDWDKNEVIAEHTKRKDGKKIGVPAFKDGEQEFTANRIRYNFITKKGIIYDITSTYNDLYVLGNKAKFISKDADTLEVHDYIYSENALFTTCDHPEPHYGIRSKKQKFVPNDVVVVGPSNLEIMGIPTPLWLPFGFFPITNDKRTGLLFPKDYEYSQEWGFGLRNIGYYFPINDYMDLSATADIYFKGTYGIHLNSRYNKRYKYGGSVRIDFTDQQFEQADASISRARALSLGWSHSQAATAHPYQTLGGSVNIQTNGYQNLTQNDARSQLNNSLSSNITYRRSFPTLPLNFSASMTHSQNTRDGRVTINLPTTDLSTNTLFPFKRKKRIGKEKWYEQITLRYKNQFRNQFETSDSTLFTQETLNNARYGMKHEASSGTSFKLLKYFSVNPSISYNEVWYLKSLEKTRLDSLIRDTTYYDSDGIKINNFEAGDRVAEIVIDTTDNGIINEMQRSGFQRYYQFNTGVSINTQIFGQFQRSKGWLRGVRHVMKPSVSMNYTPSNENRGYRDSLVYTNIDNEIIRQDYSIFEDGIYGAPSNSKQSFSLNYGITNNFEAKYFSKKDSTEHKFNIFDNIRISGSYNFAADSLQWSKVSFSGTTRLFKKITTLSISGKLDPYNENESGTRIQSFYWDTNKRIARFEGATARLNSSISVSKLRDLISNGFGEKDSNNREGSKKKEAKQDLFSLFERFNINHVYAINWDNEKDTLFTQTHTINMRGNIDLTDKWSVTIGNIGYDFKSKGLSYPDFGLSRSLHCWQMGLSTQPTRGTYQFYVRVDPSSSLSFLNVPWTKNRADSANRFLE